jgi:hypothetical protein
MVTRVAKTSSRVVLPAPETPYFISQRDLYNDRDRTYHESSQSTWLDPSIDMIQDSPSLLLDLDIIDDVLPTEDGSLSLNNALVDFSTFTFLDILGFDGTVLSARLGVGILLVLESLGDSTSLENKDFTLGLLSRDEF